MEKERREKRQKIKAYFPNTGALARTKYPRHLDFFAAGASKRERCFMAANRVGKTEGAGGYEMTLHLTGLYPDWWQGRRFDHPVKAWAAGDTNETVRDILQTKLLGEPGQFGTGLIPGDTLTRWTMRAGLRDAVLDVYVRHKNGGMSHLTLKSYEQGRKKFQGTEIDVVWLDEEPPLEIYGECLVRTMTTGGMVMLTFTPLMGLSDVVRTFIQNTDKQKMNQKKLIQAGWDDVPHLSEKDKTDLKDGLPPHEIEARSKGTPSLGAGAIYPVNEKEIIVAPFEIPNHWPRVFAMDVGWEKTAVIWGAWDRDTDCLYLYSEHYRGQAEATIHATAIKARGNWIKGVIDPAANGRAQTDGKSLMKLYRDEGLSLSAAENMVEAGIYQVWQRLSTGRLKVFENLTNWLAEYRLYHRNEQGKIVKKDDHLMDSTRYLVMSGLKKANVRPVKNSETAPFRGDIRTGY